MSNVDVFAPYSATAAVAATTTTANAALTAPGTPVSFNVRIFNDGAVTTFIAFGTSTVAATTASLPIPAGGVETFSVNPAVTHVAAITASGTATLYATSGRGS